MNEQPTELISGPNGCDAPLAATCSPEDLPDEELLLRPCDLFKVFSDTTRIKILYALMGREFVRSRYCRCHANVPIGCLPSAAHA